MIEVSTEDAFAEACRALGESVVRERLLSQRFAEVLEQNQALVAQVMRQAPEAPTDADT